MIFVMFRITNLIQDLFFLTITGKCVKGTRDVCVVTWPLTSQTRMDVVLCSTCIYRHSEFNPLLEVMQETSFIPLSSLFV